MRDPHTALLRSSSPAGGCRASHAAAAGCRAPSLPAAAVPGAGQSTMSPELRAAIQAFIDENTVGELELARGWLGAGRCRAAEGRQAQRLCRRNTRRQGRVSRRWQLCVVSHQAPPALLSPACVLCLSSLFPCPSPTRSCLHQGHQAVPPVRLQQHRGADPELHGRGLRDGQRAGGRAAAQRHEGVLAVAHLPPGLHRRRVLWRRRHHDRWVGGSVGRWVGWWVAHVCVWVWEGRSSCSGGVELAGLLVGRQAPGKAGPGAHLFATFLALQPFDAPAPHAAPAPAAASYTSGELSETIEAAMNA